MNHGGVTHNITNFDLKPGFEIKKSTAKYIISYFIDFNISQWLKLYIAK